VIRSPRGEGGLGPWGKSMSGTSRKGGGGGLTKRVLREAKRRGNSSRFRSCSTVGVTRSGKGGEKKKFPCLTPGSTERKSVE